VDSLMSLLRFFEDRSGATAIEYSLVAAGISMAIFVVLFLISDDISSVLNQLGASLESVSSSVEDP
jgi:Flp pilus assembly pilin Flp